MAYTTPSYVCYTNSRYVRIYGINSTLVQGLMSSSTNSSILQTWNAPEFLSGLLGYQVCLFSDVSTMMVIDIPRTTLVFEFGCESGTCLHPEMAYNLSVACIRDQGIDSPLVITGTTQPTPKALSNKAYFYPGKQQIILTFTFPTIRYDHDTIVSTTFLNPLRLSTLRQGVNLTLSISTVVSISTTNLVLSLKAPESTKLLAQLRNISVFSPLMLYYGEGQVIKVAYICL
jgi:hypothetical protein